MTTVLAPKMPNLQLISPGALAESPTNPRKHFNEAKQAELIASVRGMGVKQPLLVRPKWCVGLESSGDVARAATQIENGTYAYDMEEGFEVVAGARRLRAATLAELPHVPCIVEKLCDVEAFEIQLIENLQRDDLTPSEEAQGYHDALELTVGGKKVHTVASLAARVNKSPDHIHARMKLVALMKSLREAVDTGALPIEQAQLVARVPDPALREQAGLAVLHGHGDNSPLSLRETRELLKRDYMRELKGAPFDQEDAALCAETIAGAPGYGVWSGKCSDCPSRSGNIPGFEGKRTDVCTNPRCFALKSEAAFHRVTVAAEAAGKLVLAAGEAGRHFDPLGALAFTTTLVRPSTKPAEHLLKSEVKRTPTWAALADTARASGMEVPVLVCRNPKTGLVEELIDSGPIIAAAEKIGEPIFRGSKDDARVPVTPKPGEDPDDAFARGKREHAQAQEKSAQKASLEAQLLQATAAEGLVRIFNVLRQLLPAPPSASLRTSLLGELLPEFVAAAGSHGQRLFVKAFNLKPEKGAFGHIDAIELYIKARPPVEREPLCWLLLLSPSAAVEGIQAAGMLVMARALAVDLTPKPPGKPARKKKPGKGAKARKSTGKAKPAKKAGKGGAK
jgi:ParB/RepB/Spo0J family partition protein